MIQSFCSYCECLDVGQKMVFVGNFLEYSNLYLGKKSVFGRNEHEDQDLVIFEGFIDRKRIKRLRLKTTVWRHC